MNGAGDALSPEGVRRFADTARRIARAPAVTISPPA